MQNEPTPKTKNEKKSDLLFALDEMISKIDALPPQAMMTSINHYDYASLLVWISTFLRLELEENSEAN